MPRALNLACIGCGGMGRVHAVNASRLPGVRVRGFADAREEAAEKLCSELGGEYCTADPDRVFLDDDVDAVLICTWHDSHAPLAVQAARAGKHVFVEKPLALTLGECLAIEEAVERGGVRLMVGFAFRFSPLVELVHTLIGSPLLTVGQIVDNRWGDESWAQQPLTGGGNVLSQGCHIFDLAAWLNEPSKPLSISANGGTMTHRGRSSLVDTIAATMRFENGSVAAIVVSDIGVPLPPSKFFLEVFDEAYNATVYNRFTEAVVRGPPQGYDFSPYTTTPPVYTDGYHHLRAEEADAVKFRREMDAFVKSASEGSKPPVEARDGTRATHLILKAFESASTGKPQATQL